MDYNNRWIYILFWKHFNVAGFRFNMEGNLW